MASLNKFYGMLLAANIELNQHGRMREMENDTFVNEMFNKLPVGERDECAKSYGQNSAKEFLEFAKRRQAQVAAVDIDSGGGSRGGQATTSGGGGGGSGASGGARGGGGGSRSGQNAKGNQNNSLYNNQPKPAASNVAAGGSKGQYQTAKPKSQFACKGCKSKG